LDRYLVIGNPIAHSLSPQIHTAFAKQTNQILTYDSLCVEPHEFFNTLDNFFASEGKGANITSPFKSMAFEYVKSNCSEKANIAKSVNTLYLNPIDNQIYGDNTDGIGLLRDLKKHEWNLSNKNILLLGIGGATRGILQDLLSQSPASITLYNRTSTKISTFIQEFPILDTHLLTPFSISFSQTYDVIINSIPSKQITQAEYWSWMSNIINPHTKAYDLNYSSSLDQHTPFINQIKTLGCKYTLDGLGMLIEQAAESFFIWREVRPSLDISLLKSMK
jgi:shikimate dehydrogenase